MNNESITKEQLKKQLFQIYEKSIDKQVDCFLSKINYPETCYSSCKCYGYCVKLRKSIKDLECKPIETIVLEIFLSRTKMSRRLENGKLKYIKFANKNDISELNVKEQLGEIKLVKIDCK